MNRLFTALQGCPIPEALVQAVAQHQDWTRRMRADTSNPKAPVSRAPATTFFGSRPTKIARS